MTRIAVRLGHANEQAQKVGVRRIAHRARDVSRNIRPAVLNCWPEVVRSLTSKLADLSPPEAFVSKAKLYSELWVDEYPLESARIHIVQVRT